MRLNPGLAQRAAALFERAPVNAAKDDRVVLPIFHLLAAALDLAGGDVARAWGGLGVLALLAHVDD